jgi:hypothetical protein
MDTSEAVQLAVFLYGVYTAFHFDYTQHSLIQRSISRFELDSSLSRAACTHGLRHHARKERICPAKIRAGDRILISMNGALNMEKSVGAVSRVARRLADGNRTNDWLQRM